MSDWALSEMVRARLQISEEDPQDVVAERLRTGLERWIGDGTDREFIAPRIGQLLGLSTPKVLAKEELFSGWRLFFERLAEYLPVVMVVEDLQWADAGMCRFSGWPHTPDVHGHPPVVERRKRPAALHVSRLQRRRQEPS